MIRSVIDHDPISDQNPKEEEEEKEYNSPSLYARAREENDVKA